MSNYEHEHKGFDKKKQWCPNEGCRYHIKFAKCMFVDKEGTKCKNFTGISKNDERNTLCYECFRYCTEEGICMVPGCCGQTDGEHWFCSKCYEQTKQNRKSSESWSEFEQVEAPTNCVICGSDKIPEGKLPTCQDCFTTILKHDQDARKYLWKGTCMGHKHPQLGNTVTCPVCNDNGERFYTQIGRKCDDCGYWLSSKDVCSLCTAKHFKEFTKQVKPAERKVFLQRLETPTRPVTKDLAFNRVASFHTEPEPESEQSDELPQQEKPQQEKPKEQPQQEKPKEQPQQEKPKEPKQEPKEHKENNQPKIEIKFENGGMFVYVTAFGKVASHKVSAYGFLMNQVDGKTSITSDGVTFVIETDPVKKTIAFVF
jgi:hypothetical protein